MSSPPLVDSVRLGESLARLRSAERSLCFGRIDGTDGQSSHIGRIGLRTESGEILLVDWRAEAARPFYAATIGFLAVTVARSTGEGNALADPHRLTETPPRRQRLGRRAQPDEPGGLGLLDGLHHHFLVELELLCDLDQLLALGAWDTPGVDHQFLEPRNERLMDAVDGLGTDAQAPCQLLEVSPLLGGQHAVLEAGQQQVGIGGRSGERSQLRRAWPWEEASASVICVVFMGAAYRRAERGESAGGWWGARVGWVGHL